MALRMFVNPLPNLDCRHFLQFDYPADPKDPWKYCAPGCYPNINIEPPAPESLYGLLGTPQKEQGHPCIKERLPEAEDPHRFPFHDQILDIDRPIVIDHTGRLSGSFVRYIAHDQYSSIVKFFASPVAPVGGDAIPLSEETRTLVPQAAAPNVWFWLDPGEKNELLYSARAYIGKPQGAKLKAEHIYNLVCKWEFWDKNGERMPISGFDESLTFEISSQTKTL